MTQAGPAAPLVARAGCATNDFFGTLILPIGPLRLTSEFWSAVYRP